MRKTQLAVALAATLAAVGAAPGRAAAEPAPPRQIEVPGALVDSVVVPWDGAETLALLVRTPAPDEGEPAGADPGAKPRPTRDLYILDAAASRLVLVATGLPEPAARLIPLGGAPGGGEPGVGPRVGLAVVAESFGRLDLLAPLASPPPAASVAPAAHGGPIRPTRSGAEVASFDLPRRAERTSRGLRLSSPPAQPLPAAGDGGPCFATEPEAHGKRRLRVVVVCSGQAEPEELWMLLPAAETVTGARFLDLDGAPVLAVLTRERLGVFVKQELRVFPLAAGRTRVGSAPLLAVSTGCPLWRDHELTAADADGDGRDDVVLLCTRGLIDQELRVEVYPSRSNGGDGDGGLGFERRGRTMHLEGDFDSWRYGADLTGDGLPDLVAQRDGWTLQLHPGKGRGGPVEPRPAWVVAVPRDPSEEGPEGGPGEEDEPQVEVSVGVEGERVHVLPGGARMLEVLDLDGDGRREIVLYQRLREERGEERTDRGGRLMILPAP